MSSGGSIRPFTRLGDTVFASLRRIRVTWPVKTAFDRFEQIVSLVLTLLVSVIVVVTLVHLSARIVRLVLLGIADPNQQEAFQAVFGTIMTVLMALAFNHSILGVFERKHGIVQVRTVLLIGILSVVRKLLVVDPASVAAPTMFGLAATTLALGAVYWLVRDPGPLEEAEQRTSLT